MSPDPLDLSEALARDADAAPARPVDLDAVLRASRARRRTRRRALVGATASVAGLLAVGGLVLGLGALGPRLASSSSDSQVAAESSSEEASSDASDAGGDASGSTPVAPQDGDQFPDDLRVGVAETLNVCGAPIAAATDGAATGLVATVEHPAQAVPSGSEATVAVLVTNTGAEVVEGVLGTPAITVSEAGSTVWHPLPSSATESVAVRLGPGESITLSGRYTAGSCADGGDASLDSSAPAPLSPGTYGLSAAISFADEPGVLGDLIVSPAASVTVG
ncbi:hypothetical protein [Agromyces sp. Marseille-Q5079]|uniref:hypothetical protein n=1 Tax=Agromyces sp. Marseille-Q5079 TaxID=3439059 RepID=UPI003D9CAE1B